MPLICLTRLFTRRVSIKHITKSMYFYKSFRLLNSSNSYMGFSSYGCSITSYGLPLNTCSITSNDIHFNNNSNELLIKSHASPINPSDINIIEGKYGSLPKSLLPNFICGNEGIFEVKKKGQKCSMDSPLIGQFVIASKPFLGTWQQYITCKENDIIPLNINISDFEKYDNHLISQLSMISVNPSTAYRMINDFVSLEEGDYIIQNASNSCVGECVIQIARNYGIKTINIIRGSVDGTETRPASEFNIIKEHLMSIGGNIVIGDEDLNKMSREDRYKIINRHNPPKLGLNSVGGSVVNDMIKLMNSDKYKSILVTYGGMSKQPLIVPTAPLIFKDISLYGFWMTKWKQKCEEDCMLKKEYYDMINTLTQMIKDHDLEMSYKLIQFAENGKGMISGLKYALNQYDQIGWKD
eukprot:164894_1